MVHIESGWNAMMETETQTRILKSRPAELHILNIVSLCTGWMFLQSFLVVGPHLEQIGIHWLFFIGFILVSYLLHLLLCAAAPSTDETVLPLITLLAGVGIAYQYRLGTVSIMNYKDASLLALALSPFVAVLTALLISGRRWNLLPRLFYPALFISFALPLFVVLHGVTFRGSIYGPAKTTPTEFVKPALALLWSVLLWRNRDTLHRKGKLFSRDNIKLHGIIFMLWFFSELLFILQKDLGMVIISTVLLVILLGAVSRRWIYSFLGFSGAVVGGYLFKIFLPKGHVRFEAWLTPFQHPADSGYQIIQSLFALFHGAVLGRGVGEGIPGKIPLVHNDFIYASLAEELGLVGSSVILMVFFYLAMRCYRLAAATSGEFRSAAAVACGTLLWTQAFLNVGGVIKMIPMTGVPLPFISFGGSACIAFSILAGWFLGISAPDS